MTNRIEMMGILGSIIVMALALYILNERSGGAFITDKSPATVILSDDEKLYDVLGDSIDQRGNVTNMIVDDISLGLGDEAKSGDTVTVHYIGTLKNGTQFDNSYLKGEPLTLTLGEGKVIAGWEEGIVGMKEGGERILIVPPEKGYGNVPVGPIPSGSTLVFAIELLEILNEQ
jgi:hypothetical protein